MCLQWRRWHTHHLTCQLICRPSPCDDTPHLWNHYRWVMLKTLHFMPYYSNSETRERYDSLSFIKKNVMSALGIHFLFILWMILYSNNLTCRHFSSFFLTLWITNQFSFPLSLSSAIVLMWFLPFHNWHLKTSSQSSSILTIDDHNTRWQPCWMSALNFWGIFFFLFFTILNGF